MKRFTKSMLTLALLVLAVGGVKAQTETDIKNLQAANGTTEQWVASIPSSYPTSPIDVKDSQTIFGSDANSQVTNANVNKYDYIYFEVVNFSTERACRIFFWDPNTNSRKDWYIRPVKGKDEVSNWGDPANVTGNGTYCVKIPTGARLQGAKTPWVQTPAEGTLFQFSKIYVIEPSDPLAGYKDALQQAIDKGKVQNSFAKTTSSWEALSDAITAGTAELANASASEKSLTDATETINTAIAGLKLQAGYANLTADMFMTYASTAADVAVTSKPECSCKINKAEDLPYGDGNVGELNWADLTPYEKFFVLTSGDIKPRLCMNRLVKDGQQAETQEGSKMLDINPNNDYKWSTDKYQTIDGNKYTIDLSAIVADYTFARLHAIKKQGWGAGVFVTDMLIYAAKSKAVVGEAGYATFSSIMNVDMADVKAYVANYDGEKVVLTPVTKIPANNAVIIEAAAGTYELTNIESADAIADNDLLVSNGTVAGDGSSIYVLANKDNKVGFYLLKSGDKIPAGKAYLQVSASGREFIGFAEDVTAIKSVETVKADGAIYNLAGQQVKNAQKGIFVINGKKVIK